MQSPTAGYRSRIRSCIVTDVKCPSSVRVGSIENRHRHGGSRRRCRSRCWCRSISGHFTRMLANIHPRAACQQKASYTKLESQFQRRKTWHLDELQSHGLQAIDAKKIKEQTIPGFLGFSRITRKTPGGDTRIAAFERCCKNAIKCIAMHALHTRARAQSNH